MSHPTTRRLFSERAAEHIDHEVGQSLAGAVATGLVLGLITADGEREVRCYGERVAATGELIEERTCFEIGSIGKSFTAIILMQLVAETRVDLDAPVSDYLPWFAVKAHFRSITLHDLLTHTSGLPGGDDPVPDGRLEVWLLRDAETFAAPGEHFLYSNVGYKILGLVIEAVLKQSYAEVVRERIFEPLGMQGAHGAITSAIRPLLAQGYASQYDDRARLAHHGIVPATWLETDTGDGCLAMTGDDLLTYAGMLLDVAGGNDSPVLSVTQLAAMRHPHADRFVPDPDYGYGLASESSETGQDRFGHGGGMVGYLSDMLIDAGNEMAVVVMANGEVDTSHLSRFVLATAIADRADHDFPNATNRFDPFDLSSNLDLAGHWQSSQRDITLVQEGMSGLVLVDSKARIPLQMSAGLRGRGQIVADHSDWTPFPIEVKREPSTKSLLPDPTAPATKLHWGGETFVRGGNELATYESPEEWESYVGHYRSYNPWRSNFRIVIREGRLTLIGPYGHVSELVEEGDRYWIDAASRPPSVWLAFDAVVDGRALRVRTNLGETFARFFTR